MNKPKVFREEKVNIFEAALVRGAGYFEYEDYEIPLRSKLFEVVMIWTITRWWRRSVGGSTVMCTKLSEWVVQKRRRS